MANTKRKINIKTLIIIAVILIAVIYGALCVRSYYQKKQYPLHHEDTIMQMSQKYDLDPYLVCSVIYTESSFNTNAVSSADARGLMQILPDTGKWLSGKIDLSDFTDDMLFEPQINIEMGCWYLRYLFDRFDGNFKCAIAAYNAGQNRVSSWLKDTTYSSDGHTLDVIPFAETEKYVIKVEKNYEIYQSIYDFN